MGSGGFRIAHVRVTAKPLHTTMIFDGSLQAPMTPRRPAVRTRTQRTLSGTMPLMVALPPPNVPASFQFVSTEAEERARDAGWAGEQLGSPMQICTWFML